MKIVLSVALAIVLAITAVMIGPRFIGKAHTNAPKAAKIDTPAMSDTLLDGQRVAISPTEEQKPSSSAPAGAKEKAPSYNAGNIPAVTGLTREGESADSIRLIWDEIPGITSYRVYRSDIDAGEGYSLFTTVNNHELQIRNLNPGSLYGFKVAALIGGNHEGEAMEAKFATMPVEMTGLKLKKETKGETTIKWNKNEHAEGYVLERCFDGKWSEYQTFDRDTTEFTDTDDGSKSKLGRILLDYHKSAYADGYLIYNSKDKKNWKKLTDTARTHYASTRLEDGATYYFRIYAYREVDGHKIRGGYTELEFVANMEIFDRAVGDTYVEVSLDAQHMWYIVDGDVYLESDCVTGNYGTADTPEGFHEVNDKASPCVLEAEDYRTVVQYWMPFSDGQGLHDASWRGSFGGNVYQNSGSHGCINLPLYAAQAIYNQIEAGMAIIVYK